MASVYAYKTSLILKKLLDIQLIKKMAWMACRIMYFLIHQKPFENNCFRVVKTAKTLTVIKRKIC